MKQSLTEKYFLWNILGWSWRERFDWSEAFVYTLSWHFISYFYFQFLLLWLWHLPMFKLPTGKSKVGHYHDRSHQSYVRPSFDITRCLWVFYPNLPQTKPVLSISKHLQHTSSCRHSQGKDILQERKTCIDSLDSLHKRSYFLRCRLFIHKLVPR